MRKGKAHRREVAREFHALAQDSYHELHGRYPKTALAMASLGSIVPPLVDRAPGLTAPLYPSKRRRSK